MINYIKNKLLFENTQELDKIQKKINLITDEYTLESYSKNYYI